MARAALAAVVAKRGGNEEAILLLEQAVEELRGRDRSEERMRRDPRIMTRLWTALAAAYRKTGRDSDAEEAERRAQMRRERRGGPWDRRERPPRPR